MNKSDRFELARSLPAALDLITIGVEAGWSFEQSAQFIADRYRTPVADQLRQALADIAAGTPRRDALRAMADRCQLPEMTTVVSAILTSDETGADLTPLLRFQAEDVRVRQRQRVEEQIAKTPVKMTLPMVGCIFPATLITLLAPGAVRVLHDVLHII